MRALSFTGWIKALSQLSHFGLEIRAGNLPGETDGNIGPTQFWTCWPLSFPYCVTKPRHTWSGCTVVRPASFRFFIFKLKKINVPNKHIQSKYKGPILYLPQRIATNLELHLENKSLVKSSRLPLTKIDHYAMDAIYCLPGFYSFSTEVILFMTVVHFYNVLCRKHSLVSEPNRHQCCPRPSRGRRSL